MIRTRLVELSSLEAAAYRQKMRGGKTGIVILRYDQDQPGLATLGKADGEPEIAAHVPPALYPLDAFHEAAELTAGLPYTRRGSVKLNGSPAPRDAAAEDETPEDVAMVCGKDYEAVVKAYTNKKGELSYDLINKDFIQFAKANKHVADMVGSRASVDTIRDHVVKARLEAVTGNRDLSVEQARAIMAMLDEVSPKGVLREFTDEVRKLLARP